MMKSWLYCTAPAAATATATVVAATVVTAALHNTLTSDGVPHEYCATLAPCSAHVNQQQHNSHNVINTGDRDVAKLHLYTLYVLAQTSYSIGGCYTATSSSAVV
jgi:hypothetical protein